MAAARPRPRPRRRRRRPPPPPRRRPPLPFSPLRAFLLFLLLLLVSSPSSPRRTADGFSASPPPLSSSARARPRRRPTRSRPLAPRRRPLGFPSLRSASEGRYEEGTADIVGRAVRSSVGRADRDGRARSNGGDDDVTEEEADAALDYLAGLIERRLEWLRNPTEGEGEEEDDDDAAYRLARGRFADLTATAEGERVLEDLFLSRPSSRPDAELERAERATVRTAEAVDPRLAKHAICALQSLLIHGTQVGVKGTEETQLRTIRHLFRPDDPPPPPSGTWTDRWDGEEIRRLKLRRDAASGKKLLAKLVRKRTAVGAFDLLVELKVWELHEDLVLLRSGFPVRFAPEEERAATEAQGNELDPDEILGTRRDLRSAKVYTIDGPSTLDVDDGISVEVLGGSDGSVGDDGEGRRRLRYWIHIADVDRWAPRGSALLRVAERRGTSLYLPQVEVGMFPTSMSSGTMSLEPWQDKHAVSLGVELDPDGSVDPSSIVVAPSLVNVDYRLTYDQVDEMLDEGVGYTEEWEIGALLSVATRRRALRSERGSTEGMVPFPIPKGMVTATKKGDGEGGYDVSVTIETTHNSGANVTGGKGAAFDVHYDPYCSPVSSSNLIVTEMMILAGEALGKWQMLQSKQGDELVDECVQLPERLELPFRRQSAPDFKSRQAEARQMDVLLATNNFYPHAWYTRRFFNKVTVSEEPGPHFGLGLDCYVQWSSPIRRLTDLKVHSALKRHLRRKRVNEMLRKGLPIPKEISNMDLGYDISKLGKGTSSDDMHAIDPIDYNAGLGMIFAARPIQSSSSNYWLFEYIRQRVDESNDEVMFESIVLGCVNPERFQYAVYVYELGLEHRYLSETGELEEGKKLWLKVSFINPRTELLTFSLASRSGGMHARQSSAPAA